MSDNNEAQGGLLAEREAMVAVAKELWALLPDDCERITCEALMFADYSEYRKTAITKSGESRNIGSHYPLVKAMENLRKVMHKPGKGTWYTAHFTVMRPGKVTTNYDYDTEPNWSVKPGDATYAADLERYPRETQLIPAWMQDKLGA